MTLPPPTPEPPAPVSAAGAAPGADRDIFGNEPVGYPDWSHRRGEPRVFALIWMLFLMGVTACMFASLSGALRISPELTRPAARAMLVTTLAGVTLFWPALRLSQEPSEAPVRSALRDLFVVLAPAQAVVWPHAMRELAWWPWPVLLALTACMLAWGLVVGGLLACADAGRRRGRARWAWMLAVLAVALTAPALGVAGGAGDGVGPGGVRAGWMLSPLTSALELTRDRAGAGLSTPILGTHWRLIGAVGCAGGALLCLAAASGVASRRRAA